MQYIVIYNTEILTLLFPSSLYLIRHNPRSPVLLNVIGFVVGNNPVIVELYRSLLGSTRLSATPVRLGQTFYLCNVLFFFSRNCLHHGESRLLSRLGRRFADDMVRFRYIFQLHIYVYYTIYRIMVA